MYCCWCTVLTAFIPICALLVDSPCPVFARLVPKLVAFVLSRAQRKDEDDLKTTTTTKVREWNKSVSHHRALWLVALAERRRRPYGNWRRGNKLKPKEEQRTSEGNKNMFLTASLCRLLVLTGNVYVAVRDVNASSSLACLVLTFYSYSISIKCNCTILICLPPSDVSMGSSSDRSRGIFLIFIDSEEILLVIKLQKSIWSSIRGVLIITKWLIKLNTTIAKIKNGDRKTFGDAMNCINASTKYFRERISLFSNSSSSLHTTVTNWVHRITIKIYQKSGNVHRCTLYKTWMHYEHTPWYVDRLRVEFWIPAPPPTLVNMVIDLGRLQRQKRLRTCLCWGLTASINSINNNETNSSFTPLNLEMPLGAWRLNSDLICLLLRSIVLIINRLGKWYSTLQFDGPSSLHFIEGDERVKGFLF